MKKILLILILALFMINFVGAGNDIINYMTEIIYEDCKGKDIDVSLYELYNNKTGEQIPIIKKDDPRYLALIFKIVEYTIENEPYGVNLVDKAGMVLLTCEDHKLTANFYTYKWDGERIDPFIYNTNQITNQVINQIANMEGSYKSQLIQSVGNENININKQSNWFSDNWIFLTVNIVFTLVSISLVWKFFIKKRVQLRH